MSGSDEWSTKASALVRHALPVNMVPTVTRNILVDAIADGMASAYVAGRQDAATSLENWLVKFSDNLKKAKGDLGDE